MFRPEQIQEKVRRRPFIPLRFVTSSGEIYDVHHPDLVMVGERSVIVGTARSSRPGVFDRTTELALMHISALEDLAAPAPPDDGASSDGDGHN